MPRSQAYAPRTSARTPGDGLSWRRARLVAGKRSWFELAVLAKGELDEKARGEWLAVLASAHLD